MTEATRKLYDENERLTRIVRSVVRNLRYVDDSTERDEPGPVCGPLWGKVAYVCGLGSTSAIELCREFGVDPNHDSSRIRATDGNH